MHRWLVRFLKVIDVRFLYIFAFIFIVPPTLAINKKARCAIYRFYRLGFNYSPLKAAWMTYRNHCAFSQVVIDKFAMYAGKKYRITIDGYDRFLDLTDQPSGFVQLSSHIGNYEIAGYSLFVEKKRMNALVFAGEKQSVMANRGKLFGANNIRMIPMSEDMSHLFVINQALADGDILSMPADRIFGSQKAFEFNFFDRKAKFPQGPFIIAAIRNVPMLFVSVMKQSAKHYHIVCHNIDVPSEESARKRAEALAANYVSILELTVRQYPSQWYNFFDFWAN